MHVFFRRITTVAISGTLIALSFLVSKARATPQETYNVPGEEIVANLAAGRVIIAVVKDAMVVGTVESPIEAGSRLPSPTMLGSERVGILLGAVEWVSPVAGRDLARLDKELPRLRSHVGSASPHLRQYEEGAEAADIEAVGQGLLERLNQVAGLLHSRVELPVNEPIAELIIADYLTGYGPEVWQLTYGINQEQQKGDYWDTRVLRPVYLQFWPPEKGQPRTLIEFNYPPKDAPISLLQLLRQRDPRLTAMTESDAKMAEVANDFLAGESNKILAVDAVQFLRAALTAISTPQTRETFLSLGRETGVQWILAPPSDHVQPEEERERGPDVPSLKSSPSSE